MRTTTFLKVLTASFIAVLPIANARAQIKFIDYKTVSYEDVLKKAQAANKNIYIDIWTPWCGVCKMMDRYIFPRKDVGEYFNRNFINLSFDAENPQWVTVAKNFNATAFPTMLIVNPKGEVIMNIDNLGVPMASDATSPASEVGNRLMFQAGMADSLISLSDTAFASPGNARVLADLQPAFDTGIFSRIVALKDIFLKQSPAEFTHIVDDALGTAAVNMVSKSGHAVNTHKVDQYRAVVNALNLPQKSSQLLMLNLNIALATRQWKQAVSLVEKHSSVMTPLLYAALMEGLTDGCQDKALLRTALKLCEKPVNALPEKGHINSYIRKSFDELKKAAI